MFNDSSERAPHWQINSHTVTAALKVLGSRSQVDKEALAQLEVLYLDALDPREYRILNLEQCAR